MMIEFMKAVSVEVVGLALVVCGFVAVMAGVWAAGRAGRDARAKNHDEVMARMRVEDAKALNDRMRLADKRSGSHD